MSPPRTSIELLLKVGGKLMQLPQRLAFVGGVTTGFHITDPLAPSPRATIDVDVILDVATYTEYTALVAPALRRLGAYEDDSEGAPLCRWLLDEVMVDVMPIETAALGFSNRWYPEALASATAQSLPDGTKILVIDTPHFVATKIEAFLGRGHGDFLASKDVEDIIAVLDGRAELAAEVRAAELPLRQFLCATFRTWLTNPDFHDAVLGYLGGDQNAQARADIVISRVSAVST